MTEGLNARFFSAVRTDNLPKLHAAIEEGVDLESLGNEALFAAIGHGDTDIADALINSKRFDVDTPDDVEFTALMRASYSGNIEIVKSLLAANADPDIQGQDKQTALHYAAEKGHEDVIQELITADANLDVRSTSSNTPLLTATRYKKSDAARILIANHADVNIPGTATFAGRGTIRNVTPLMSAARDDVELMKALIVAGAELDAFDADYHTALHHAVEKDNIKGVELLLAVGAEIDPGTTPTRNTPLMLAIEERNSTLPVLLAAGADPNVACKDTVTPVQYYAQKGNMEGVKLMLAAGAETDGAVALARLQQQSFGSQNGRNDIFRVRKRNPELYKQYRSIIRYIEGIESGITKRPTREEMGIDFPVIRNELSPEDIHTEIVFTPEDVVITIQTERAADTPPAPSSPASDLDLGHFTRQALQGNDGVRAEHDALQTICQSVADDAFKAELIYREVLSAEQVELMRGAGVEISRRYGNGPTNPEWNIDFTIGAHASELEDSASNVIEALQETLGIGEVIEFTSKAGKRVHSLKTENIREAVEALNEAIINPKVSIIMSVLESAVQAEIAQNQPKQNDLGRG